MYIKDLFIDTEKQILRINGEEIKEPVTLLIKGDEGWLTHFPLMKREDEIPKVLWMDLSEVSERNMTMERGRYLVRRYDREGVRELKTKTLYGAIQERKRLKEEEPGADIEFFLLPLYDRHPNFLTGFGIVILLSLIFPEQMEFCIRHILQVVQSLTG